MEITKTKISDLFKSFTLKSEQSDNKEDKIQEVLIKALKNFASFNFKGDVALLDVRPLLKRTSTFLKPKFFDLNALLFFTTLSEENLQLKREERKEVDQKEEDQANSDFDNQRLEIKRIFHF